MESATNSSSATTITIIDDLCDELLIKIFILLPSYKAVVKSCKLVSKRWLSLLSHPEFEVDFLNHKIQNLQQPRLPWAFMSTLQMKTTESHDDCLPTHTLFTSPTFTLNFLPCYPSFQVSATFKDLVLCRATAAAAAAAVASDGGIQPRRYYICNPLTKQWIALPPTPPLLLQLSWACLLCQDPFYDANGRPVDYIFRVVIVHFIPTESQTVDTTSTFKSLNLIVYCSEASQWRQINLKVPLMPPQDANDVLPFFGVVCEGVVCLGQRYLGTYFSGMFNPFDITLTSTATPEALMIQLHPLRQQVLECGGRLISLLTSDREMDGGRIALPTIIMEFDPNTHQLNYYHGPLFGRPYKRCAAMSGLISRSGSSRVIGMHPDNRLLLYILLSPENQVVLCDLKSECLKPLGTLPPNHLRSSSRLELQHWPTPLPHISC